MATYAIGDIHGNLTSLKTLITQVKPTEKDTIVFLGDYVDRGLFSKEVIDEIIALKEVTNVITLKGNHEVMMLFSRSDENCFNQWMGYGGFDTVASYMSDFQFNNWYKHIPESHWIFIKQTIPYYEIENHIFVHAAVDETKEMSEQTEEFLYWNRFDDIKPHQSGKTIICGHTSNKQGIIRDNGHAICIDTWPLHQWLTCLNVDSYEFVQANEDGGIKMGNLR